MKSITVFYGVGMFGILLGQFVGTPKNVEKEVKLKFPYANAKKIVYIEETYTSL